MKYKILSVLHIVCFAFNSLAANQTTQNTKAYLMERYPPEKRIVVQQTDGTKITGLVVEYQDDAMLLLSKKLVFTVPYKTIQKISLPPNLKPVMILAEVVGGLFTFITILGGS